MLASFPYIVFNLLDDAGMPTTTLSGTSFVTAEPAATTTLFPMVTTGRDGDVSAYPHVVSHRDGPGYPETHAPTHWSAPLLLLRHEGYGETVDGIASSRACRLFFRRVFGTVAGTHPAAGVDDDAVGSGRLFRRTAACRSLGKR